MTPVVVTPALMCSLDTAALTKRQAAEMLMFSLVSQDGGGGGHVHSNSRGI